jgi:hypothetical protein
VDTVIVEVFEASPSAEDVLAAQNALQWDFPGRAVEIPFDEFSKTSFRENLAIFLEQASMESLKRFEARSAKASVSVIETRDTTDPALITQMLMPLLEAVGSSVDVPRLRKRVRDDVNIQDAELPWRRLPFWLVLRVVTQRQLSLALGDMHGRVCYKFLICTVLAQLLKDCAGQLAPELTVMLKAKLCRRLAKLEMDKNRADSGPVIYKSLFDSICPLLKGIIDHATQNVESAWANFKTTILRPIPSLPPRADEQALYLSLQNSGKYFSSLLILPRAQRRDPASMHIPPSGDGTMEQVTKFTNRYFSLARLERRIKKERNKTPQSVADCQARCLELARLIVDLFDVVGDAYDSNPEQMSIFILSLFDLWSQMDECAVKACPLLGDYAPMFRPSCWMFCISLRCQACIFSKIYRNISGADITTVSFLIRPFSINLTRTLSRCDIRSSRLSWATCGKRSSAPRLGRAETRNPNGKRLVKNMTISVRRSPAVLVFAPSILMGLAMLKDAQNAGTGAPGEK